MNDFKATFQFTENEFKEKIESLEKNMKVFVQRLMKSMIRRWMDPEFVKNKLMDLQDKSTRNNLRMHGVTETNDDTCEKCEEHVEQVFSEKLGLKNISVERVHRLKRRKSDKSQKTCTIISNLLSFKEKKISYE